MLGFKKTPYLENVAKLIIFDYLLKFVKYLEVFTRFLFEARFTPKQQDK